MPCHACFLHARASICIHCRLTSGKCKSLLSKRKSCSREELANHSNVDFNALCYPVHAVAESPHCRKIEIQPAWVL